MARWGAVAALAVLLCGRAQGAPVEYQAGFPRPIPGAGGAIQIADLGDGGGRRLILRAGDEASVERNHILVVDAQGRDVPGWPLTVAPVGYSFVPSTAAIAVGDVDPAAPGLELVVSCATLNPELFCLPFVFHADGTPVEGWPPTKGPWGNVGPTAAASLVSWVDESGAGRLALLLTTIDAELSPGRPTRASAYLYDRDGSLLPGWPVVFDETGLFGFPEAAVSDLTGDGRPEIVLTAPGPAVFALTLEATPLPGFPFYRKEGASPSAPLIADLDGDGAGDIAFAAGEHLYAIDSRGGLLPGFPAPLAGPVWTSPIAADLDGDGRVELVYGTYTPALDEGELASLDAAGRPGPLGVVRTEGSILQTPVAADLDGDGRLEVAVGTFEGWLVVVHGDGTAYPSFPRFFGPAPGVGSARGAPAVGDLDGDGDLELALASNDSSLYEGDTQLFVWDFPGPAPVVGWPSDRYDAYNRGALIRYRVPLGWVTLVGALGGVVALAARRHRRRPSSRSVP